MKLPQDQRQDGEALWTGISAGLEEPAPARPAGWRRAVRGVVRWLRLVVDGGAGRVEMPDRLRDDVGLPPAEPPRRPDPFDRPHPW